MCCFAATLVFFGPRLGFLVYWLLAPVRVNAAVQAFNFPWLVSIAGLIFAPWTMLMYVIVFPLNGWDWLWIGLGIMADVASWMGAFQNRKKVPYYPENDPIPPA
jgi:hypothetical protein